MEPTHAQRELLTRVMSDLGLFHDWLGAWLQGKKDAPPNTGTLAVIGGLYDSVMEEMAAPDEVTR